MVIHACYISHRGKVRSNNEDSLLLDGLLATEAMMEKTKCFRSDDERHIFAVADGMGGHARGEIASRSVLAVFKEAYQKANNPEDIRRIILSSKNCLNKLVESDRNAYGLGTTIAGVLLFRDKAIIFNCGDSRVYRLKSMVLERITKDHTLVQELFDVGGISEEEMRHHPQKNVLTSAVIGDLQVDVPESFFREMNICLGERFLICSDGLWESMALSDIKRHLANEVLEEAVQSLFAWSMAQGARDNISIIALEKGY